MSDQKLKKKVGVMIPTFSRPDFARFAVLQWVAQTVKPDVLCIFQNNNKESYEWVVEDLKPLINIKWIHMEANIPQHMWYSVPLRYLLDDGCDCFFWGDHDDIYYINHVEKCLEELEHNDFTIAVSCGVLFVQKTEYKYKKPARFLAHAPGGMSSSMAFNRNFALETLKDIEHDLQVRKKYYYTDNVVAFDTMPKFLVAASPRLTSAYVVHDGSHSSNPWLTKMFQEGSE